MRTQISIGDQFGDLTVVAYTTDTDGHGHRLYACRCICGKQIMSTARRLTSGNTKSCGCRKARVCRDKNVAGPDHPAWKGGSYIDSNGYRMVHIPLHPRAQENGYVAEHIVIAGQKLGRTIDPYEEVHHCDGNRLNNDPSNLMVFLSKAAHAEYHHKMRAANG